MEFRIEILEQKVIHGRPWLLCKGNLKEYLESLKDLFYDFAIQRRIVKNQYLDSLFQTIKRKEPIPIITLTYNEKNLTINDKALSIDMSKVEILDGLQRTFRLWSYKKIGEVYNPEYNDRIIDFVKNVKQIKDYDLMFDSGVISSSVIKELIKSNDIENINEYYKDFDIYFIIWVGLDDYEIVRKMLVLNAGQKQVSKVHQFELLFLHVWDELKNNSKIKIVREKDPNAYSVKKGEKETGEFMFSSVIVAMISLIERKPLRVATENLITEDFDEPDSELYQKVFKQPFVDRFLNSLFKLDSSISFKESVYGKAWFVKDTSLSGFFAAIGKYIDVSSNWTEQELESKVESAIQSLDDLINSEGLKLSDFKNEYDSFSSRNVNIGNHIRKVIAFHIEEVLKGSNPLWKDSFQKIKEGK